MTRPPGAHIRDRSHYSYAHYADRGVAEGFDALRFGGPIGQYLLESQRALLLEAVPDASGRRVLDVGTGTGRAALVLAGAGATVTGIDSSPDMLRVARSRAAEAGLSIAFEEGDAHALPLSDRSVDVAVCLRLLMHAPGWRQCVREICRVARWRVVVDFPALASAAAFESGVRAVAARFGRPTEAYRVIAEGQMRAALESHGFHVRLTARQFVLPIALHKALGSVETTRAVERLLAGLGLRRLFGSPVTMVAER